MKNFPHPLTKASEEWAREHSELGPDEMQRCKKTGKPLLVRLIWRTITMDGSGLEVKLIGHLYCQECVIDPDFPDHGAPIDFNDLVGWKP